MRPALINLSRLFPNASDSTISANPQLLAPNGGSGKQNDSTGILKPRWGQMNKTEYEFSRRLQIQKRDGEILRWEYEGITLRWADVRYTPDFIVFDAFSGTSERKIRLIEIKGAFMGGKFERAIERFRHARTFWPEFKFELWQKQKGTGWVQKL